MRIKKFNENLTTQKSTPFTNSEMMDELIAPILKYDLTIYYKIYTMYDDNVLPQGPKHRKNFSDTQFWDHFTNDPVWKRTERTLIHGCIIDINTEIFSLLSSDEQRMGRGFSNYNFENLSQIFQDIERIKDDCITEAYTLSMFISNDGFNSPTNFNSDAQISLLILDGHFN
jgi:hypothetical protein